MQKFGVTWRPEVISVDLGTAGTEDPFVSGSSASEGEGSADEAGEACPMCTYRNPPGATNCDICASPLPPVQVRARLCLCARARLFVRVWDILLVLL